MSGKLKEKMKISFNSVSNIGSIGSTNNNANNNNNNNSDEHWHVVMTGYAKKVKTMKKKYFVLSRNKETNESRLDYYDSEKKYRNGTGFNMKKSILFSDCFTVIKHYTKKGEHSLAIYTNKNYLPILFESKEDFEKWFQIFQCSLSLINEKEIRYDNVWQVNVDKKGLGEKISGCYRLCLTSKALCLVRLNEKLSAYEFSLTGIRKCGHNEIYFYIEVGRSSPIGPGDLWMLTGDTDTAHHMHETILTAMKSSKAHEELGPTQRPRSASTSENTNKPLIARRPTSGGIVSPIASIDNVCRSGIQSVAAINTSISYASIYHRDRCESMPSRSRATNEQGAHLTHLCKAIASTSSVAAVTASGARFSELPHLTRPYACLYNRALSYSPPANSILMSPSSGACSTDSAGSSLSVDDYDMTTLNGAASASYTDYYCPSSQHSRETANTVLTQQPITEEDTLPDDYLNMDLTSSLSSKSHLKSPTSSAAAVINIAAVATATTTNTTIASAQLLATQQRRSLLNLTLQSTSKTISSPSEKQSHITNIPSTLSPMFISSSSSCPTATIITAQQQAATESPVAMMNTVAECNGDVVNEDTQDNYIIMSPISSSHNEKSSVENVSVIIQKSDCNTTRSNSSDEKCVDEQQFADGYVQMNVGRRRDSEDDSGYLKMSMSSSLPKLKETNIKSINTSTPQGYYEMSAPAVAFSSINPLSSTSTATSGTIKEEFRLETVKSYFPPEEETLDFIKPVRSYSMGSRPQIRSRPSPISKVHHERNQITSKTGKHHNHHYYHHHYQTSQQHNYNQSHSHHYQAAATHQQQRSLSKTDVTSSENDAMRIRAYSAGSQSPTMVNLTNNIKSLKIDEKKSVGDYP